MEVVGIVKTFPGVRALDGVNLKVKRGEVHAIVGENGAGKSTLMLTLGGVYRPDAGEIYVEGVKVHFDSPHDANKSGISVVYQELSLVQNLSVAENIFANRQPVRALSIIDRKLLYKKTYEMLALFKNDNIKPDTLVKDLSMANQQVVEILKAMSFNPKILILDEPTSSLTETETRQLFENIKILKNKGIACIYISHHLNELFEVADTVTILKDGAYVCDAAIKDVDEEFLITNMVGRKIENIYGSRGKRGTAAADDSGTTAAAATAVVDSGTTAAAAATAETVLEVKNLSRKGAFNNISFCVRRGEIVGFAGLIGAGRTELGRSIFGAEPPDSGSVVLEGKQLNLRSPDQAINNRIAYMTEDRKTLGLYLGFDIVSNLSANRIKDFSKNGFVVNKNAVNNAEHTVSDLRIATPGVSQLVVKLSGGNQQKVLLGAWLGIKPKLLIVDEPTRGVDIGAKSEIYAILRRLAGSGVAIMMISSDLPEILGVSDRIIIMKEGEIAGELDYTQATEDKVISFAAGAGRSGTGQSGADRSSASRSEPGQGSI